MAIEETVGAVMRRAREAFLVEVGRVMGRGFDSVLDERLQDAFEHAFVGACAPYVRAASRGVCAACGRVPELSERDADQAYWLEDR